MRQERKKGEKERQCHSADDHKIIVHYHTLSYSSARFAHYRFPFRFYLNIKFSFIVRGKQSEIFRMIGKLGTQSFRFSACKNAKKD